MRLRVLTLNIHKGIAAHRPRLILRRLKDRLRQQSADIVLLQEVIGESTRLQRRYADYPSATQFEFLADTVWPFYAYGRNAVTEHSDHGNAVLSRWPIRRWRNEDLSVPGREYRSCLLCELDIPGPTALTVASVHLGLTRWERRQQLERLSKVLAPLPRTPLIVGGDFNDWRGAETTELERTTALQEAHRHLHGRYCRTFPAYLPFLPLDRLYTRDLSLVNCTRADGPWRMLSDHQALVAELEF